MPFNSSRNARRQDHRELILSLGERLSFVAGLVLAVSAFTSWYSGSGEGVTVAVTAWHTGTIGKLVFFIGLAVIAIVAFHEFGAELPAAAPESLVTIALGSIATVLVLVRVVSKPDDFFFAGRSIGLFISLVAAVAVIVAGILQASEDL